MFDSVLRPLLQKLEVILRGFFLPSILQGRFTVLIGEDRPGIEAKVHRYIYLSDGTLKVSLGSLNCQLLSQNRIDQAQWVS